MSSHKELELLRMVYDEELSEVVKLTKKRFKRTISVGESERLKEAKEYLLSLNLPQGLLDIASMLAYEEILEELGF